MGTISWAAYRDHQESIQAQVSADAQKSADHPAPDTDLVNLKMHTIVDPQDTFEALANELFGFPRSE